MDKTWRERIAEARARGHFTSADIAAWCSTRACLVGEAAAVIDEGYNATLWCAINWPLGRPYEGSGLNEGLLDALERNDFDFVEDRLDVIEDRVLVLKRERAG